MPQSHRSASQSEGWAFSREAAEILGISRDTLLAGADAGHIPCWRMTPTSQRRFDRATLRRMRAEADAAARGASQAESA